MTSFQSSTRAWHSFDPVPRRSYFKFLRASGMPASQAWAQARSIYFAPTMAERLALRRAVRTRQETCAPKGKCPDCGKVVVLQRDMDGVGQPRSDGPLRFSHHAGNQWGRPCRGNGEQFTGDES